MNTSACSAMVTMVLVIAACGGESTPPPPSPDLGTTDAGPTDGGIVVCTGDAQCDDDVFCNGPERCLPAMSGADARGCLASTGIMCLPSQTCNEAMRLCETSCDTGGDADGDGSDAVACGGDDCDDSDATTYPGNTEVCDATGHDEDCNPATLGPDVDGDTFISTSCCNTQPGAALDCGDDCNDTTGGATVHPGAIESCNLVDDDCNAMIDEGRQTTCYLDADGDDYAPVGAAATMMCTCGAGYTAIPPTTAADCNDASIIVNPAVPDVCNGMDDNCNGMIDEGVANTYYRDLDGDGQGAAASGTVRACSLPATGYAADNTDCDDACSACRLGATEVCDVRDNDCNAVIDENLGAVCTVGVGACQRMGQRRCNGICTATAGTADAAFHTSVAPNGSWDWNCDGVTTPQVAITDLTHASATAYCQAQICNAGFFDSGSARAGPTSPGAGLSPYCGLTIWRLTRDSSYQCLVGVNEMVDCTTANSYDVGSSTQACR